MKNIFLVLMLLIGTMMSGCAVGPLVVHETARSLEYWASPTWLFSIEASSLFSVSDVTIESGVLIGAALGYKF